MKNRINICHVDLWHAQTTKMTTNKTKTIQDYLGGSSVQKSTCTLGRVKDEKSKLGITAICFFGTILDGETEFTALLMFRLD
jgi:hypothetical protein